MAKPEWGLKRICQSCAVKFYDMRRAPIVCPSCGATFDPETLLKSRRPKPVAAAAKAAAVVAAVPVAAAEEDAEATENGEEKEEEPDKVMEDTSELGSEEEDVAEVIDKVNEEER